MTESRLERFVAAQGGGEYEAALDEIAAGRKVGHWIWYIFPQLAGLGMSHMSQTYAIRDRGEAVEYLRHPVLAGRLLEISNAAAAHLRSGVPLDRLMGSSIDAAKLVSSMTLFGEVVRGLPAAGTPETTRAIAHVAEAIVAAASLQGYAPCEYTLARLRAS